MRKIRKLALSVALSAGAVGLMFGVVSAAVLAGVGAQAPIAVTAPDSKDPAVAYGGGAIHAVWVESDTIMYSQKVGSASWTPPVSVTGGTDPTLAIDRNGRPHVALTDFFSPTYNVYHTYLSATWQLRQLVSNGTSNTSAPDIAVAPDGTLYLVWSEQVALNTKQIKLSESTNDGASWPTVGPIPNAEGNAPKIAVGTDNAAHVVWQDAVAPYRIKHTERSTSTWSLPAALSDAAVSSFAPDVASSGGKAHVVWQQSSSIRYAHGAKLLWSTPVTLSTGSASEPSIAANGQGALVAAWDSGTSITLRMGGPGGWGTTQALGAHGSGVGHVDLASGPAGWVHAVFAAGASGSRDIWYNSFSTKAVYLPALMKNAP